MTAPPLVAVITPTFEHARYIGRCIETVLAQSLTRWEMVIVDDGSTDQTVEIARSYADTRIRVVSGERRGMAGLGATYNTALSLSMAPLVAVLEGDDEWPPEKLALQAAAFEDADVVLSYGAAELVDEAGCRYARYSRAPRSAAIARNDPPGSILEALAAHNFVVASTVLARRSALDRIGGFWQPNGIPYVDHPTWLRLALEGRFDRRPEVVGRWRRHASQWTTRTSADTDPDRTPYVAEVLREAVSRGIEIEPLMRGDRVRLERWAHLNAFRQALLHSSLADGARAARPLLATGRPSWWAMACLGVVSRLLGSDLEWLFRMTNRFSWPSRRHLRSPAHRR